MVGAQRLEDPVPDGGRVFNGALISSKGRCYAAHFSEDRDLVIYNTNRKCCIRTKRTATPSGTETIESTR